MVSDGRIFIGEKSSLLALDLATDHERWSYPVSGNARIAYAPIESDGVLYFGPGDGTLCAIKKDDGTLLWRIDREKDWQYLRQLHISDGILVAGGYHDELFGIRLSDGALIWRFYAGNFINSPMLPIVRFFSGPHRLGLRSGCNNG
ncbi:MAG: PQQ-like beta-propeller repeat protein [Gammaproteobacteria bacterium]|nr:PQQ-like beta-propeller repeat protein [Gammaproteobacteria bacterium]